MKQRNNIVIFFVVGLFFGLILLLHIHMFVYSDDIVFAEKMKSTNVFNLAIETWKYVNGRFLLDPIGAFFVGKRYGLWKVLDTSICTLALILLYDLISTFTSSKPHSLIFLFFAFLSFPVHHLISAGFVMTTSNYLYPVFGMIVCFWIITKYNCNLALPLKVLCHIIALPCAMLASNHDQTALVFISLLLIMIVACFINDSQHSNKTHDKEAVRILCYIFVVALVGFGLVLFSPAHSLRAGSTGGAFSVPGYEKWSLIYKLYKGYTSTAANLLYYPTIPYLIFCICVFMTGLNSSKKIVWLVSALPLLWAIRIYYFGNTGFAYAPEYGWGMLDLCEYNSVVQTVLLQAIPLIILVCIIITIFLSCKHKFTKISVLSTLLLSLGTRVMMGLSSTLFGSSFRTMILLIMALIFGSAMLFAELCEQKSKLKALVCLVVSAYFGIAMYISNMSFLLKW